MREELAASHKEVYHLLLVDDDENFRKAHKRLLHLVQFAQLNGRFEVTDADSADNAIAKLKERRFDCVLLDYVMPGRDGLSCLKEMLSIYPDLPVILFTGAGNESIAAETLKHGAMDYLIKGKLSLEILERAIVNVITRQAMVKKIEEQRKQLLEAERHRVMVQTLGAACHHLSQPITVLRTCLVMIKRNENISKESHEMIISAFAAIESLCDILWKMNHVVKFSTESYLNTGSSSEDNEILKI